jgi:hypothetical protein
MTNLRRRGVGRVGRGKGGGGAGGGGGEEGGEWPSYSKSEVVMAFLLESNLTVTFPYLGMI